MKNYLLSALGATALTVCLSGAAQGTLVGDVVTIQHVFPTIIDIYAPLGSPTVTEGSDDTTTFTYLWLDLYTVNIEASQILVDFSANGSWASGPSMFNGLLVSDLNDDSNHPLTGAVTTTNLVGWDDGRLLLGNDFIGLNFQGLAITTESYLNASLYFSLQPFDEQQEIFDSDRQTPVPEPATLFLFGSGLIGFGLHARRSKLF